MVHQHADRCRPCSSTFSSYTHRHPILDPSIDFAGPCFPWAWRSCDALTSVVHATSSPTSVMSLASSYRLRGALRQCTCFLTQPIYVTSLPGQALSHARKGSSKRPVRHLKSNVAATKFYHRAITVLITKISLSTHIQSPGFDACQVACVFTNGGTSLPSRSL